MKLCQRICAVATALIFCLNFVFPGDTIFVKAEENELTKDYIVCTKNKEKIQKIEKKFKKSKEINNNAEDCLEKNAMTSVKMTESEAKRIQGDSEVCYVEEDALVEASAQKNTSITRNIPHKKEELKLKKNTSGSEWNVQMIHAEPTKIKAGKDKVKVAILDSGIDDGNDINLTYSVSLVPGEEELSPLFMDGTGHGNSVAGLIAAEDNEEGIRGIAPETEIYSIRVLDDYNKAPVSRIVEGIYMAIEEHVNIINMSFGMDTYSEALETAVRDAHKAGILLVAAAGNTGNKGVQYPAAFDEVIAVGSVDKTGEVVDSSAIGEEVEIVAPGELVRSTGEFGAEKVESGTSLAAPQVAAVAAKIWEKDIDMPAEFVREVLAKSSNCYGERNQYGNGLLDASYALENYKLYKKEYKKKVKTQVVEQNKRKVMSFEETGCVKGSWVTEDHESILETDRTLLKKGAKFPDSTDYKTKNGEMRYAQMGANPWWHGHFNVNYVSTFIYETELANNINRNGTFRQFNKQSHLDSAVEKEILDDINNIPWAYEAGANLYSYDKRAFIWGMALHNLADSFSHSTGYTINGVKYYLSHNAAKDAHNKRRFGNRYECAKEAVRRGLDLYFKGANGNAEVFLPGSQKAGINNGFYMINISEYINAENSSLTQVFESTNCGYGELSTK